jgi:hypothetical protein
MRKVHLLLFIFAFLLSLTSEATTEEPPDTGWLRQSPTRTRLSLNGLWEWKKEGEDTWSPIQIPSAFDFVGEVTLRRRFEVDSTLADRTFLLVGWGINHRAVVTVNGKFVGTYTGYYSGLEIEIPAALIRVGQPNEIALSISNRLDARYTLPLRHQPGQRRNYGGILREIFLFSVPANRVQSTRTRVTFADDFSRSSVAVRAVLKGQSGNLDKVRCSAEVWDPKAATVVARSPEVEVDFADRVSTEVSLRMEIDNPRLWSLNDPFRCELRLNLWTGEDLSDQFRQPLGLRQLVVTPTGLQLNGQPIVANGVDWVEGYGETGSPVASLPEMEKQIARVRELGARFLRVVAHPPHPYLLDVADRKGVLIFLEIPLRGVPPRILAQPDFADLAESELRNLIQHYASHPSVAAWGLGYGLNVGLQATNADEGGDIATKLLARLQAASSELDDRPVYYVARALPELERPLPVDLVMIDLFERSPADILYRFAMANDRFTAQPMLARIGYSLRMQAADASGSLDPKVRVEERQAYRLQRAMARLREMSASVGLVVTALTDWEPASPPVNIPWQSGGSIYPAGLLNMQGEKRVSFSLVQADFTGDTLPHISQVAEVEYRPTLFPILGLSLILGFVFFFNRDRRLRGHLRRVFVHPHGFYLELREMRKIPPFLTTLLVVVEVAVIASLVSSTLLPFRESLLFDEIVDLLLPAVWLKTQFKWLMWHPAFLVGVLSLLLVVVIAAVTAAVWFLGFLIRRRLPYSQLFTLVVWSGACFLWLLIAVPAYYRLMQLPAWRTGALTLFAAFIGWFAVRLFRGVRAVYFLTFLRALFLVGVFVLLVGFSIALYYDRTQALFAFLPYYWSLLANL